MNAAILVFPGTNREYDAKTALEAVGAETAFVWHKDRQFDISPDIILIPGGFSWGDYLRAGAIAAQSPIMNEVVRLASRTRIIGICNGFQILCEAGLLPGVLMRNRTLRFIARAVHLKIHHNHHAVTRHYTPGQIVCVPVAHNDGNYFINDDGLKQLEDGEQILFSYCAADGRQDDMSNINGARAHIAGICNDNSNIIGMMPHPENAIAPHHPSRDGLKLFQGLCDA